jgi:hypothetical protein
LGIAWLKAGIWELKQSRRRVWSGRRPLCLGEDDAKNINAKRFYHGKTGQKNMYAANV